MKRAEKLELIQLLEEKDRRTTGRLKLSSYYPDTGPLRRELYKKHTAFFRAGILHRERLMLAANRVGKCISGDTLIESPFGQALEVSKIKGRHWVYAWDGEKRVPAIAEEPFTKPSEMVYRVWLQSGRYLDCAAEHRFLSEAGWLFLSDLFESVPCLPASSAGIAPLMSFEDVLCSLRIHRDFQADCRRGYHLDDEQPPLDQEADQASSPSPGGAPKHIPALWRWDALVGKCRYSLSRAFARLSSLYEAAHLVAHFAESSSQALCSAGLWCHDLLPESRQSSIGSSAQFQSIGANASHQGLYIPALITPEGSSDLVVCYQPIGVQPIYDFHVPQYMNYCTGGLIHHNTEGVGGFETALHLTGLYPPWWDGRRFDRPIDAWAAGDTTTTVRDIVQFKLIGPIGHKGSGLIPKDCLLKTTGKRGAPDAVDTAFIKHISGGVSQCGFKSYDQRRESFQGTEKDVIWLDEESPLDIYTECLMRGMTNNGMLISTFTPLMGMTELIMQFFPGGQIEDGLEVGHV